MTVYFQSAAYTTLFGTSVVQSRTVFADRSVCGVAGKQRLKLIITLRLSHSKYEETPSSHYVLMDNLGRGIRLFLYMMTYALNLLHLIMSKRNNLSSSTLSLTPIEEMPMDNNYIGTQKLCTTRSLHLYSARISYITAGSCFCANLTQSLML